jgi:peptidoglycan/xylan/chitin deacetylase (PgdA/CDA1 family)
MFQQYFSGMATVFMLHSIHPVDSNKISLNEKLNISPDFLDAFIVSAKAKGYSFISLDTLHDALVNNKKMSKTIVLTLDDGYADNYTNAYPIFKKHNIPFTIYITTSFPNHTAILWWYILEDLVIENNAITLNDGTTYSCETPEDKKATFSAIRQKIIHLPKENFIDSLNALFEPQIIDWYSKVAELSMTWEQIKELSLSPLATIGGHTVNHYALATLSKDEVIDEVMGSKQIIEAHIDKSVEHFCYPFGGPKEVTEKEFAIVDELGFKTTTTTRYGSIFSEHKNHLSALPRVMLTSEFSLPRFELSAIKRFVNGRIVVA